MGKFESVIEEYTFNRAKDCVRIGDRRTFSIFVSQFNIFSTFSILRCVKEKIDRQSHFPKVKHVLIS